MLNSNFNTLRRLLNITQKNSKLKLNTNLFKLCSTVKNFSTEETLKRKNLIDFAEKELIELKKTYEPVQNAEKEEFLAKNRWVFFDYEKENYNYMELKKNQDDYDITVRFAAKTPETPGEERGQQDPERILDFYVSIQRNNTKSGLFAECATIDSSINVNQIHYTEDISVYAKNFFDAKINENYSGPEFSILDERLQQEFIEIFLNFGIDDNLGSFIEVMSVDMEQKLYINWLKNVVNVLH